jgi:hypothetical protein
VGIHEHKWNSRGKKENTKGTPTSKEHSGPEPRKAIVIIGAATGKQKEHEQMRRIVNLWEAFIARL